MAQSPGVEQDHLSALSEETATLHKKQRSLVYTGMEQNKQDQTLSSQNGKSGFTYQKMDQKFMPWDWFYYWIVVTTSSSKK